jgi:hypothetical protein
MAAPAFVLGCAAVLFESTVAAIGAFAQFIMALLFLPYRFVWRPPASGLLLVHYLMTLAWLWFATRGETSGLGRLILGLWLLGIVGLWVWHDLLRTGLQARRLARKLCRQLTRRTDWPTHPEDIAAVPEVRQLPLALELDPTPALKLLRDPRKEVVLAALIALQNRAYWRSKESDYIVACVQDHPDPVVKIAGLRALAAAADAQTLAFVTDYLQDRTPEVRRAASEMVPIHDEQRWPLLREPIKQVLAQREADDLFHDAAGHWCEAALCDLATWANEPEPLGTRAGQAVVRHYGVLLHAGHHPTLAVELARQITDKQTPPALRVELALLLRSLNLITPELLDRMTDVDQPGPLRMLAAEMLLAWNPQNPDAIDVLRGLGRQSNRETALAIARLLQKYLKLDMGLPEGKLPPNSKQAAETARRVFTWATGRAGPGPAAAPATAAGSAWILQPPPTEAPQRSSKPVR